MGAAATDMADEIGVQAILWREFLDPDGAEPREERAHRKRAFRFGADIERLATVSRYSCLCSPWALCLTAS